MTDGTTDTPTPEPQPGSRRGLSGGVKAAIAVAVVIVLAGAGYAVYKLTDSSDVRPAYLTAKDVVADLEAGDLTAAQEHATDGGATALAEIDRNQLDGLEFGNCAVVAGDPPTRLCVWNRPGGQLTIRLVRRDDDWLVTNAEVGPAGIPPETDDSPPEG